MKKTHRVLSLFICLLLCLGFSATALAAGPPADGADLSGQVVILHTNDVHGHVDDNMGYAAVAALKSDFEQAGAEVLLLDAGDTFHGMPYATLNKGADVVALLNQTGYEATVPGNHDFNYGTARLEELAAQLDFPVLAANVVEESTGELLFAPSMVVEKGGASFGIFGLATPETAYKTNPTNVEGILFQNPEEAAAEQVAALREEGVDYIVALTHLGVDASSEFTADKLAAAVEGIDVIIDGHSHTEMAGGKPLDDSIQLAEHGDTLIASTGCYIQNIGVITLQDGVFEAALVNGEDYTERDAALEETVEAELAEQQAVLSEVVGSTPYLLQGEREYVRRSETNMGNFTTDAFLWASGADVAMINGGTIRASIPAGDITKEDLITVYPFGNYLLTKEITGAVLKSALEHGVSSYPELAATFPHPGGMTYTLNAAAQPGSRIEDLKIGGEPMEEDKTYIIAFDDFLAAGGDDYTMLADLPEVSYFGGTDEILAEYLKTDPPIHEEAEGRITVLDEAGTAGAADGEAAADGADESAADESGGGSEAAPAQDDASSEAASDTAAGTAADTAQPEDDAAGAPAEDEEAAPAGQDDAATNGAGDEAQQEAAPEQYTVVPGDCLWNIAKALYGDGMAWSQIYQLNSSQISDPNLIYPGQVFQLP